MPRTPLPLLIEDASAFADNLRKSWPSEPPGHLAALNLIARAAGYRSWQSARAAQPAPETPDNAAMKRVAMALRVFDAEGRMIRWPKGHAVQRLCMSAFWSRLPSRRDLSEKEVNQFLQETERFGDHVLLRRSLIDHGFATRTADGATYRRVERKPDAAERAVIRTLSERWAAVVP